MITCIFLHPKALEAEAIDAAQLRLSNPEDLLFTWINKLSVFARTDVNEVSVATGRDHFQEHAQEAGGWAQWGTKVAEDHDVLIVTGIEGSARIGKATADILAQARQLGKTILWWPSVTSGDIGEVVDVVVAADQQGKNQPNFKNGWELVVKA